MWAKCQQNFVRYTCSTACESKYLISQSCGNAFSDVDMVKMTHWSSNWASERWLKWFWMWLFWPFQELLLCWDFPTQSSHNHLCDLQRMIRKREDIQWVTVLWVKMCWWWENAQNSLSWKNRIDNSKNHLLQPSCVQEHHWISYKLKQMCYSNRRPHQVPPCQLRTGNWGNKSHGLTKIEQDCLMGLDFCFDS